MSFWKFPFEMLKRFGPSRAKYFAATAAAVLAVFIIVVVLFHLQPPTVKGSNVFIYKSQIASNSPITIKFDQMMNRESVEQAFEIFPEIGGRFEWNWFELTFVPEERFKVGEAYAVTLPETVTNILGQELGKEIILNFVVVDPPKVSLAVPNGETNVNSKITVMFDRPMTEMTTYDVLEARDFPLQLTPTVEGRFKWIGTSAFQFIPKERFAHSTAYTAVVPSGVKALSGGEIEVPYTFNFQTPRIALSGTPPPQMSGHAPLLIRFNQEVNLESFRVHTTVKDVNGKTAFKTNYPTWKDVRYDEQGKKIEEEKTDKNSVEVRLTDQDWGYENEYMIEITKGISGLEGNLSTETELKHTFRTNRFLTSMTPADKASWVNPFGDIALTFDQDVDLGSVRDAFAIQPAVNFKVNYGKKCKLDWEPEKSPDEECPKVDDFTSIVFSPQEKLKNLQYYKLRLSKNARAKTGVAYLKKDVEWFFNTADSLRVLRTTPADQSVGSYRLLCIFTSTQLQQKDVEKQFVFTPPLVLKAKISQDGYYLQEMRDNYATGSSCVGSKPGERYVTYVSMLMNPETSYTVTLKGSTEDIFGQKLGADFTMKYTTEALRDEDTSLEMIQRGFYAVATLDQHAAPVFVTRNLTEFTLEICRISAAKFIDIDTEWSRVEGANRRYEKYGWQAFSPGDGSCEEYKSVTKSLKQLYWQRQYTEVDIAKELGEKPKAGSSADLSAKAGYYYIRASSPRVYRLQQIYDYDEKGYSRSTGRTEKIYTRPSQVLTLTNTHIAIKRSRDTALFWVTDMASGKPVKGALVRLYTDKGQEVAGSGVTDKDGLYRRPLDGLAFSYVVASRGNDHIVANSNWSEGIAPWDFQLGYSEVARYTQGYIYTDRPLYRPTHQVFFKGILRDDYDVELRMPKAKSIEVEIFDSRRTSIYKKTHSISAAGTFGDSITLDEKAPLGRYDIETCLETAQGYCKTGWFTQSFSVEEYRKPEYKLDVTFQKDDYVDKEDLRAVLDAEYFFGAPVPDGKVSWSLRSQNYYFDEYDAEWFSFTDHETFRRCYWGCPYEDQHLQSGEGNLDADGTMVINHKIDLWTKDAEGKPKQPDASKIYTLAATVQDRNNQTVAADKSIIVHRGEYYVGVKNEEYIVQAGGKMPIKVITVDHKGKPMSGKSVELELFKLEWKYVKKKNVDGGFYWDNELDKKLIKSATVTTDSDGMERYEFSVKDGGEYLVRATGKDTKGNVFSSTVDFYATTYEVVSWKQENNNRMELKLDKVQYDVGDTAKVLVKSPYKDVKALLTLERGDIMESRVIDIISNSHVIDVPITEKMLPNFYISVLEIKGGNKANPPDFKAGYANVVVDAANKELKISIKMNKARYQPRERVQLEITTKDRAGNPVSADVSVAAVDASLLALKGNPKRDLLGLFYNRRALGVETADSMTKLLERVDVQSLQGSKGGSGKGADEFAKVRGKFEDTAFWRTSLTTAADGKITTSFELPDNLTTWNIEVVGATTASLFGSVNNTITTQKPVIVRPVLPRFALFGDELRLAAIVHNFNKEEVVFRVTVDAKNLSVRGDAEQQVRIPADGSVKLYWNTAVPPRGGVAHGAKASVTISAESSGDYGSDAIAQEFPIYSYSTPETVALSSFTDDVSFTENIFLPSDIDPAFGELKITTGATVATYISDSLNYLLSFPYGCVEQTVSSILPNVILKNAVSLPNLSDKIKLAPIYDDKGNVIDFDTVVQKALQRIYAYQRSDGGWGYWPDSKESYSHLTAYTLFALEQIKKADYSVDQNVINRAVSYVRDYMASNRDRKDQYTGKLLEKTSYWANSRAYMLFVMAETGRGDVGLSNSLYEDRKLLSNNGKVYLAMTLHKLLNQSAAADKIAEFIRDLENQARIEARGTYIRNDDYSGFSMMTATKVTALTVQMLNRVKPDHPLLPKLIKWLIGTRKDGHWSTTQDTMTSLIALAEFLERTKETEAEYTAKIKIDRKVIKEYTVGPKTILDQQEVIRAISEFKLGGDGNDVVFAKDGTGRLYYDMVLRYFLPIEDIKPRSEGFNIERRYYRLDDEKLENPVTTAKAGETLRGHITLVVPEDRTLVALENFLPAGLELVNFEFETADKRLSNQPSRASNGYYGGYDDYYDEDYSYGYSGYYFGFNPWTHKELRDDRLFLFADRLSKGVYEYDYYAQVTSEGKFHHPPAVASEMYFPENFGRTNGEWITITE